MRRAVSPRRPDPTTTIPKRWLKAALKAKDVPATWLARRLGIEPRTVYRWLSEDEDATPITRARWIAILAALDLPLEWTPTPEQLAAASRPPEG